MILSLAFDYFFTCKWWSAYPHQYQEKLSGHLKSSPSSLSSPPAPKNLLISMSSSLTQGCHWILAGFLSHVPSPGNSLKIWSCGNRNTHTIYIWSLRDPCPLFHDVKCHAKHCFMYFVQCLGCLQWVGKSTPCQSTLYDYFLTNSFLCGWCCFLHSWLNYLLYR